MSKQPGLDDRHRNEDGTIHKKRNDTQNQNLPSGPIPGFGDDKTLKDMAKRLGLPLNASENEIRRAAEKKR